MEGEWWDRDSSSECAIFDDKWRTHSASAEIQANYVSYGQWCFYKFNYYSLSTTDKQFLVLQIAGTRHIIWAKKVSDVWWCQNFLPIPYITQDMLTRILTVIKSFLKGTTTTTTTTQPENLQCIFREHIFRHKAVSTLIPANSVNSKTHIHINILYIHTGTCTLVHMDMQIWHQRHHGGVEGNTVKSSYRSIKTVLQLSTRANVH